jgi:spore germination cell wall hydrolase CwlJ-like protein
MFICGLLATSGRPAPVPADRLVAAVLIAEAGGEARGGLEAVAVVVAERIRETGWSAERVVCRRHAFSCLDRMTPGGLVRRAETHARFQAALGLARNVIQHPERLAELPGRPDHYCRFDAHPDWSDGEHPVARVGRHVFFRLRRR